MHEPSSIAPEDELFERWFRRGDMRALGALFDATAPRLLRLAIHLVGDAVEAEDLVQAVFLAALERPESVDLSRPAMPWLVGVLANKARQHRRRAARVPEAGRLALREVEDASRPLERRELDGEVARAIDGLGEPYRAVLVLRLRHGLEAADIAHVLERDPGTVRVQLHRGLEKLRAILPAALASSLVLGLVAPRGLAAVKATVLEGAAAAAAGASSSLVLGSVLMSKKVLVAAAVLVLAAFVWLRRSSEGAALAPAGEPRTSAPLATRESAAIPEAERAIEAEPAAEGAEREAVPPSAPAALLSGRVVDAETQEPIPGASLRVFAPRETHAFALLRERSELYQAEADGRIHARTRGDWPLLLARSAAARFGGETLLAFDRPRSGEESLASTRADGEGAFQLEFPPGGGVLEGASADYATRWRAVRALGEPCTLELWREREAHGVVIGPDGEPVHEPIELVFSATRGRKWKTPELTDPSAHVHLKVTPIQDSPFGDMDAESEAFGVWSARTDERRRFRVQVGAPSVAVSVLTPGWGMRQWQYHQLAGEEPSDEESEEFSVFVFRTAGFHFFDAASRAPIERVRLLGVERSNQYVRWAGEFSAPGGWLAVPGDWSYVTSEKGTLAFVIWSERYAAARLSITDIEKGGTIEVPMERGEVDALQGIVTRGGAPLAGAEVALLGHSPLQWSVDEDAYVDAVRTDAEGRFRLGAPSGSYILRVRAEEGSFLERVTSPDRPTSWLTRAIQGHEPFFQLVELPAAAPFALDLAATNAIEVEIVDALGLPQPEHVIALRADDGRQMTRHTDLEGHVRWGNLPAGHYRLTTPDVNTFGSWSGGQQREVELAANLIERVRIELPVHTGPRHVRIAARGVTSFGGWRARYDQEEWESLAADGTVPMDLTTDRFELEIASADGRHWHLPIPKDAPDGHVIELDAGGRSYRGALRGADGSPWPGVDVHAVPWGEGRSSSTRVSCVTDERGEFELAGLGAGEHRLRFQTCLERTLWDESENQLAGVSFVPSAPPSAEGTWLAIAVAAPRGELRLRGEVVDARGELVPEARLFFECETPCADGTLVRSRRRESTHTDERGSFELVLPRTPAITVRVYAKDARSVSLTQALEPVGEEETVRLVLP